MRVDYLTLGDLSDKLIGAWRELAARAVEPNPFCEPELVLPALRHLDARRTAGLLAVRTGDRLHAALPVIPTRHWRKLPLPVVAGWRHDHSYLGTPLVDDNHAVPALAALLDAVPNVRPRAAALALELLADDGPVADTLLALLSERGTAPVWWESATRAVLRREGNVSLNGRCKRLRRKATALRRDHGDVSLVDLADEGAAIDTFLSLEAASWKGRTGTALASKPGHATFFSEACRAFADGGRLELVCLQVGTNCIAMRCNFLAGDAVFHFKAAFDEGLAKYSPGTQLLLAVTERDEVPGVAWRDSCADPADPLFNDLWPDRRPVASLLVPVGGVTSRTLMTVLASVRAQRRARADAAAVDGPARSPADGRGAGRGTTQRS